MAQMIITRSSRYIFLPNYNKEYNLTQGKGTFVYIAIQVILISLQAAFWLQLYLETTVIFETQTFCSFSRVKKIFLCYKQNAGMKHWEVNA